MGVPSSPSQYRPISLLSIISKFFEALINKKVVVHLEKNKLFSNKQYEFSLVQSIANVLNTNTHRIS